jgi:predicted nucleic acid-binding protein
MIILNTNVLSEPLRTAGNPIVAAWLDRQDIASHYLTTISLAELFLGVELLPIDLRRSRLEARLAEVLTLFGDRRVLPFDLGAARYFSILVARAASGGRSGLPTARSRQSRRRMALASPRGTSLRLSPPGYRWSIRGMPTRQADHSRDAQALSDR